MMRPTHPTGTEAIDEAVAGVAAASMARYGVAVVVVALVAWELAMAIPAMLIAVAERAVVVTAMLTAAVARQSSPRAHSTAMKSWRRGWHVA